MRRMEVGLHLVADVGDHQGLEADRSVDAQRRVPQPEQVEEFCCHGFGALASVGACDGSGAWRLQTRGMSGCCFAAGPSQALQQEIS